MMTRMPAARHSRTASGTDSRSGSAKPTRPRSCSANAVQRNPAERRLPSCALRHGQHADALARQRVDIGVERRALVAGQPSTVSRWPPAPPWRRPTTLGTGRRHTRVTASSSGRSGYSRSSDPVARRARNASSCQVDQRALHRDRARCGSLASAAVSSSRDSAARSAMTLWRRRRTASPSPRRLRSVATRHELRVSVPVLSVHSTVAAPSVSMAARAA